MSKEYLTAYNPLECLQTPIRTFLNGFDNWLETYHAIVEKIQEQRGLSTTPEILHRTQEKFGRFGFYTLAKDWTDKFEKKYEGKRWGEDEDEWYDEVEKFVLNKLK